MRRSSPNCNESGNGEVKDFGEIHKVAGEYGECLKLYNKMNGKENTIRATEKKAKCFGMADMLSLLVVLGIVDRGV